MFQGCFIHACPSCYPDRTLKHPKTGASLAEVYAMVLKKKSKLEALGMKYICIWSHDWELEKQKPEVKEFVSTLDLQPRLDPRDSFFGGR